MTENTTADYRRVPILRPGDYTDMHGRRVTFSPADLARIAENYDPRYSAATVNIDHAEQGPALGVVGDVVFDGEYLCADLTNVPSALAREIDAGRYPFRSAEVYADLDGRGLYLRAVALLGARPPAVKGLPGWPAREPAEASATRFAEGTPGPDAALVPLQQRLQRNTQGNQPHIFHIISEVRMPHETTTLIPDQPPANDAHRLAEENHRLAEENRRLRRSERRREISVFLAELRDNGQLTPAMEQAGLEEALLSASEQPVSVVFPDGRQAPLRAVLGEVFRALPVSFGAQQLTERDVAAVELSADERSIAASLGLTEQEYAEIKLG